MVRVVEQAATKETTCGTCRCKLEYGFNDMVFSISTDYTGGRDKVSKIKCPNCNNHTYVPVNF